MRSHILKLRSTVHPDIFRRLASGASWGITGSIVVNGIALISTLLLARILGSAEYGRFVVVQTTVTIISLVSASGISIAAPQFVAEYKNKGLDKLSSVLMLTERIVIGCGLFWMLFLLLCPRSLIQRVLGAAELTEPLSIAGIAVFLLAMDAYHKGILVGFEAMRSLALSSAAGAVVSVPIFIVLSKLLGIKGAALGFVITAFIQCLLSRRKMNLELKRHGISRGSKGCWREWRVLRDLALPSLLAGLLVQPVHWVCQTLLARSPNGFEQVALLGIAMQWFNAILFLPQVAGRIVLPVLAERVQSSRRNDAIQILRLSVIASAVVGIFVAAPISFASPVIMSAYGPRFAENWETLVVAACTAVLVVTSSPLGQFLAARKKMWSGAAMNLLWAVIFLGLAFRLSGFGAFGILISLAIAYMVHVAISVGYVYIICKRSSLNH